MRISSLFLSALFTLAVSSPAFALSIDNETGLNTDGSAKYTDPDDQEPSMLNTPLHPPGGDQKSGGAFQITPGGPSLGISGGPIGQPQQQQDAFEHAYSHFGN